MRMIFLCLALIAGCGDHTEAPTLSASVSQLKLGGQATELRSADHYQAKWEYASGVLYQLDATGDDRRPRSVSMSATIPANTADIEILGIVQSLGGFTAKASGAKTPDDWMTWIDANISAAKSGGKPISERCDHAIVAMEYLPSEPAAVLITVTAR